VLPDPLIPDRNSLDPDLDCVIPKENIKAVAFSRTGDRFIAVSDTAWFLWEIANSSDFSLTMQGKHEFVCRFHLVGFPY
jgi:hypothetical protein